MRSNKLIIFVSTLLTLFFLELFFYFFVFPKNEYNYKNRYLIFSEGEIFRNINNFFTYEPNKEIIASNYYFKNDEFNKVYEYKIFTNNLGLVQKNDINNISQSILFLGDSFTEGQGAPSWINKFNGKYKHYQIINGGFLGTGFQQFNLIDNFLSDYNVKKVFVLFIGDDLRRDIFQFNNQQLSCLKNHKNCLGTEGFYSYSLSRNDPKNFLIDLRKKQKIQSTNEAINFKLIRRGIKSKISDLYIVKIPMNFLKSKFYKSKNKKILRNFDAIESIINKYDDNIYFVHLKMRDEILNKKMSYESIYAKDHIKNLTKNYFECTFNDNLSNFYEYDRHPNKKGYESLYNCILNILKKENI